MSAFMFLLGVLVGLCFCAATIRLFARRVQDLEDILGSLYLYVKWRWLTKQLTTEQKERWADAVVAWSTRLDHSEPPLEPERWWRPDYREDRP